MIPDDEIPTELPTGTNKEPTGTCTRLFMKMRYILFVKLIAVQFGLKFDNCDMNHHSAVYDSMLYEHTS